MPRISASLLIEPALDPSFGDEAIETGRDTPDESAADGQYQGFHEDKSDGMHGREYTPFDQLF